MAIYDDPYPEIGAGAAYGHGFRQLWKHFLTLFIIGIIIFIIGSVGTVFDVFGDVGFNMFDEGSIIGGIGLAMGLWGKLVGFAYGLFVVSPVNYGVNYAYLRAARNERLEVADMFESFRNYINAVLASFVVGVVVTIGFILLIIPGIIFACKLVFTPYLVVDRKMGALEAMQESWRLTNGNTWTVFLVGLLSIPVFILGLMCLGVGVIISLMWIKMAFASLYYAVSADDELHVTNGYPRESVFRS